MMAPGWDEPALQSVLDAASPEARSIEGTWWIFFGVAAAVWLLVMLATAWALARRRPDPVIEPLVNPGPEPALLRATTAAGILTGLILIGLLVASARTGRALATPTPDPLEIELVGQRWWWQVQYPADTPSDLVITANEVHVPVGRPVLIRLASRDVIHSLWVPGLQGKRDLIPGVTTELRFTAQRAGLFRGQCAEFCGLQHAHMGLLVIAEPEEQFQAWLVAQRAPARAAYDPASRRGQALFLASSCPVCHGVRGTPAAGSVGPDLTHVASRSTLGAATLPNTPADLAAWVRDPHALKRGVLMPPLIATDDEVALLANYLSSLK